MNDEQKQSEIKRLEASIAKQDQEINLLKKALREIRKIQEKKNANQEEKKLEALEDQLNNL